MAVAGGGDRVAAERAAIVTQLTRDGIGAHGRAIAARLHAPALVTLTGELGAGKTTLAQAICRGLGVAESVTSPTYALVQEYEGASTRVVHCDLYRLSSSSEVASLGLGEMLGDADTIMLVEWPERAGAVLPAPVLAITLAHVAGQPDVRECRETWTA